MTLSYSVGARSSIVVSLVASCLTLCVVWATLAVAGCSGVTGIGIGIAIGIRVVVGTGSRIVVAVGGIGIGIGSVGIRVAVG